MQEIKKKYIGEEEEDEEKNTRSQNKTKLEVVNILFRLAYCIVRLFDDDDDNFDKN